MKKFLTNRSIHHLLHAEKQPLEIYPMKISDDEFESNVQQMSVTSLNAIKVFLQLTSKPLILLKNTRLLDLFLH